MSITSSSNIESVATIVLEKCTLRNCMIINLGFYYDVEGSCTNANLNPFGVLLGFL